MESLYTLALEAEDSACLGSFTDGVLHITVDSGDGYFRAENGFHISNRDIAVYVVALALENGVGLYVDTHEEVSVWTAVDTAVALTADTQCLSVIDTCGDVDGNGLLDSHSADAAALGAGVLDYLALASAVGTWL